MIPTIILRTDVMQILNEFLQQKKNLKYKITTDNKKSVLFLIKHDKGIIREVAI